MYRLSGGNLGGFHDRFRHGGVRMNGHQQIFEGGSHLDRHAMSHVDDDNETS